MASNLYVGVQTQDLPTITVAGITGATINTAGFSVKSDRGVNAVVEMTDPSKIDVIMGRYRSSMYGRYVIESFFKNLEGLPGTAYIKRQVPADSVASSASLLNANTNAPVKLWAGRKGLKDNGTWGNQLYRLLIASSRGGSTLSVATALNDTYVTLDSVAPFKVYDWVTIAGANTYTAKITRIDESLNRLYLGTVAPGVNAIGQAVTIKDFTLKVYLKDSDTGNMDIVETIPYMTMSPESEHYVSTVINDPYVGSDYIFSEKLTATAEDGTVNDFPVTVADAVANATALTGGSEGTALTTTQVAADYLNFDTYDILYLSNTESFSESIWDDGEAYCNVRKDCVWIGCPTENMSYGAGLVWTNKRRKSRKIYALNNLNWIQVDDPIGVGVSPLKNIPNTGHIIGYAIRETTNRGVHKVPASRLSTLSAVRGIVGEITKKSEIRDLANAGLNIISDLVGSFAIRTARTPSKLKEWSFVNALIMSIYFKKSFETALVDIENEPNTAALLFKIRDSMISFALAFYEGSSNGGSDGGFASFLKSNGQQSTFNDVVKVIADDSINPIQKVNDGELRANFYFMAPAPAERILIGVGLLFLG